MTELEKNEKRREKKEEPVTPPPPAVTKSKGEQQHNQHIKDNQKIVEYTSDEIDFLTATEEEMDIDNDQFSDLTKSISAMAASAEEDNDLTSELPAEALDRMIKDPTIKTVLTDIDGIPDIRDTLKENDEVSKMTLAEMKTMREKAAEEKNQLIMTLAIKPYISLHIHVGTKDGKSVWIEKAYDFNPVNKRNEYKLNMQRARIETLNTRYNIIGAQPINSLSKEEIEFLSSAKIMNEVLNYKLSELEGKIRLGMPPEDFARVDTTEFAFALQVLVWRTIQVPFSRRGR